MRQAFAGVIARYFAGDASLISEIQTNAEAIHPINQMAREALRVDPAPLNDKRAAEPSAEEPPGKRAAVDVQGTPPALGVVRSLTKMEGGFVQLAMGVRHMATAVKANTQVRTAQNEIMKHQHETLEDRLKKAEETNQRQRVIIAKLNQEKDELNKELRGVARGQGGKPPCSAPPSLWGSGSASTTFGSDPQALVQRQRYMLSKLNLEKDDLKQTISVLTRERDGLTKEVAREKALREQEAAQHKAMREREAALHKALREQDATAERVRSERMDADLRKYKDFYERTQQRIKERREAREAGSVLPPPPPPAE